MKTEIKVIMMLAIFAIILISGMARKQLRYNSMENKTAPHFPRTEQETSLENKVCNSILEKLKHCVGDKLCGTEQFINLTNIWDEAKCQN